MKIVGNHIAGALTCTDNVPAPSNLGLLGVMAEPNVVGGQRSGQTCLDGGFREKLAMASTRTERIRGRAARRARLDAPAPSVTRS
jgi:hypothetical protein